MGLQSDVVLLKLGGRSLVLLEGVVWDQWTE